MTLNPENVNQAKLPPVGGSTASSDGFESPSASGVEAYATLDHERATRCGHGEVVYAAGKQPDEVVQIMRRLLEAGQACVLATRCREEQLLAVRAEFDGERSIEQGRRSGTVIVGEVPNLKGPAMASLAEGKKRSETHLQEGGITVVTAGTSDMAVAEEAVMTCRALGWGVCEINDVGVAGVHRILAQAPRLRAADVVIVVAGMEGALPSVVGGLVDVPVIAVPTSVGYGASFGGLSALLGMLNSCASGVTVVNIDNGFGAGYAACQILRAIGRRQTSPAPNEVKKD